MKRQTQSVLLVLLVVGIAAVVFWTLFSAFGNSLTAGLGSSTAVLIVVFLIVLSNLDRAARIVSWIYAGFSWLSTRLERGAVGNRIKGEIGEATKKMNSEGGVALLPLGVKVEWVDPKSVEKDSFIKEGNVVVLLEHHKNAARNLARATSLFVTGGLIPSSRAYVDPQLMEALDLAVARKLLALNGRMDAVETLTREILIPEMHAHPMLEKYLAGIESMDRQGSFTRILMKEYAEIWSKQYLQSPSQAIFKETIKFADMMSALATRTPGSTNVLELRGTAISTHILPVARDALVNVVDISPHLDAAVISHKNGFETMYVVARGKVNSAMAELVSQGIERQGLYVLEKVSHFNGQMNNRKLPFYVAAMRFKES